jgi:stage V sporulation protein G
MMGTDTISVSFEVVSVTRLHNAGRVLALATVEIDLDGIELTMSGIQIVRLANGRLQCKAPHHRLPTGQWVPSIVLPDELERAIGAEILAAFTEPCT